ncbi:hypothetical protein BLNAU_24723 [Blattamonas nauphoetae]|uniref:Uncharacterized protein n=1 Tax=Blattamonas nauphoetae TaxID=2049346 RepID=A0ABQ9WLM8_9EUKA|nr:hypothetical protein BLNAU_24723 [Blattamonas nauphoetae]
MEESAMDWEHILAGTVENSENDASSCVFTDFLIPSSFYHILVICSFSGFITTPKFEFTASSLPNQHRNERSLGSLADSSSLPLTRLDAPNDRPSTKIEEITHPSPLLVDSENTDNNSEDQGWSKIGSSDLKPRQSQHRLICCSEIRPNFSSEPAVEFFTPKTKTSRPSQRWGGEGEAEEKGQSGRKEEGSVWDEPDSFPAAQPPSPPISASSARLASFHALPLHPPCLGGRGVVSGTGGEEGEEGVGKREKGEGRLDGLAWSVRSDADGSDGDDCRFGGRAGQKRQRGRRKERRVETEGEGQEKGRARTGD